MPHAKLRAFCFTAASFLLLNTVTIELPNYSSSGGISLGTEAYARSSGGRSRSGSFSRSSPSRSSGSSSSTRSRSSNSGSSSSSGSYRPRSSFSSPSRSSSPSTSTPSSSGTFGSSSPSSPTRTQPSSPSNSSTRDRTIIAPVPVPVPVQPRTYPDSYRSDPYRTQTSPDYNRSTTQTQSSSDDGDWIIGLIFLGVSLAVVVLIVYWIMRAIRGSGAGGAAKERELDNDIMTISKIQVALLAQAGEIQAELTNLTLDVDTSAPDGSYQLLQESVLQLLRNTENWSHVLAQSETVNSQEEAEMVFDKLSITERSKFSSETLSNVNGTRRKRELQLDPDEDPASYIVVTLLVGTAHDKPLFQEIRTVEQLEQTLQQLAAISADYLMVFELLWSPQDTQDSLTYDELLTEYTDMLQL